MRSVDAATLLNGLNGTTSLAPIIGAFLSDAYLGRYLALAIASVASLIVSTGTTLLLSSFACLLYLLLLAAGFAAHGPSAHVLARRLVVTATSREFLSPPPPLPNTNVMYVGDLGGEEVISSTPCALIMVSARGQALAEVSGHLLTGRLEAAAPLSSSDRAAHPAGLVRARI